MRRGMKTQTINGQWVRRNLYRPKRARIKIGGVRNQKRISLTVTKLANMAGLGKRKYWPGRAEVFCQMGWISMGSITRKARKIETRSWRTERPKLGDLRRERLRIRRKGAKKRRAVGLIKSPSPKRRPE